MRTEYLINASKPGYETSCHFVRPLRFQYKRSSERGIHWYERGTIWLGFTPRRHATPKLKRGTLSPVHDFLRRGRSIVWIVTASHFARVSINTALLKAIILLSTSSIQLNGRSWTDKKITLKLSFIQTRNRFEVCRSINPQGTSIPFNEDRGHRVIESREIAS